MNIGIYSRLTTKAAYQTAHARRHVPVLKFMAAVYQDDASNKESKLHWISNL